MGFGGEGILVELRGGSDFILPGTTNPTPMADTLRVTPEKAIPTILVRKESGGNYESIMHGFSCLLSVKGPATGSCLKIPSCSSRHGMHHAYSAV